MLSALPAHAGQPPQPHDLWQAWNLDPLLIIALVAALVAYQRGREGRRGGFDAARGRCFVGAVLALGVALVSPLEALSGALASAHMVQHLLLVLVAGPLLALSSPASVLLRAGPRALRKAGARGRRRVGLTRARLGPLRDPATVWVLHVATLWFWHAAGPYDAAVEREWLHVLEHATLLVTAWLFWRVVVGSRAAGRVSNGLAVLLVFTMALQSVLLSALLTFARSPWYSSYATTTQPWGLEPLADQQLAGVIMWIPAGLVYAGAALALFVTWVQSTEHDAPLRGLR